MTSDESSSGRITPFEVVFGDSGFSEREFPAIDEEASRLTPSVVGRDRFAALESVGRVLAQLVPETVEPGALDHFLAILFHCFNFWKADQPVYAFESPVLRRLVDSPPTLVDWEPAFPNPSFYVEMPQNLFWSAVSESQAPEPLEGFFVDVSGGGQSAEADVLMILGMRSDRPGFGVVAATLDLAQVRDLDEPDAFASEIPGAQLAGLYSMQRNSEIGILLLRLLWYIDAHPESLEWVEPDRSRQREVSRAMPTALSYQRVSLPAARSG